MTRFVMPSTWHQMHQPWMPTPLPAPAHFCDNSFSSSFSENTISWNCTNKRASVILFTSNKCLFKPGTYLTSWISMYALSNNLRLLGPWYHAFMLLPEQFHTAQIMTFQTSFTEMFLNPGANTFEKLQYLLFLPKITHPFHWMYHLLHRFSTLGHFSWNALHPCIRNIWNLCCFYWNLVSWKISTLASIGVKCLLRSLTSASQDALHVVSAIVYVRGQWFLVHVKKRGSLVDGSFFSHTFFKLSYAYFAFFASSTCTNYIITSDNIVKDLTICNFPFSYFFSSRGRLGLWTIHDFGLALVEQQYFHPELPWAETRSITSLHRSTNRWSDGTVEVIFARVICPLSLEIYKLLWIEMIKTHSCLLDSLKLEPLPLLPRQY